METFKDYYAILGIACSASADEIRSAYRAMSVKWHPDKNPGVDVTSKMQDINEAYAILKDAEKRARYDKEYALFTGQIHMRKEMSPEQNDDNEWRYSYDVHDEELKEDIKTARAYSEKIVSEFLKSLKSASKDAAKGAWEGARGWILGGVIFFIIGCIMRMCADYNDNISASDTELYESETFTIPDTWTKYVSGNNAFSLYVPNTVELRRDGDAYTRQRNGHGLYDDVDMIFQQRNLSDMSEESLNHYCRILIRYVKCNPGDLLRSNETEPIDAEMEGYLNELAEAQVHYTQKFLGKPSYRWIKENGINAIEIKYRRTGDASGKTTTHGTIYLLFNYDEMVEMVIAYREQEADMWLPDFDNIIKTFRWE